VNYNPVKVEGLLGPMTHKIDLIVFEKQLFNGGPGFWDAPIKLIEFGDAK
jgi:hypothetical protein